jgi:hypothetical protein
MRTFLLTAALVTVAAGPCAAQTQKIALAIDARSEAGATGDATTRLVADVRRGLEALADVQLVPQGQSRRTVWLVAGSKPGFYAASVMVTERYDRETLMVLGIEDDDMAERMMALQIANDHQIFTSTDPAELARRIVDSINTGVLARLRARPPRP